MYSGHFEDIEYGIGDLMDELRKRLILPVFVLQRAIPRDSMIAGLKCLEKEWQLEVEHIHLPVQSGSTEMLKIMARKYSREHYLETCKKN